MAQSINTQVRVFLYESLTNMLELKDFRFSLWQVFLPCKLYEKVVFKSTSAEPLPRRAIGTGQLSRLRFRAGPIARRGGRHNAIFYLRCVRQDMWVLYESLTNMLELKDFRFSLWQVVTAM